MFCREIILKLMNMSVSLRTAMFIELRTFLLRKKTNPRPMASYGPKASYRYRTHLSHPNANVLQGNHTQTYEYERVSSNRYVHRTKNFSAYSYEYHSTPARLFARALRPKFSDAVTWSNGFIRKQDSPE